MSEIEIPERPALAAPRRKWRKRFFFGSLIVVPLCLVCLGIPILYFLLSSDHELREAMAEADRLDPGWRAPELEAKRSVIPDEENSALVLLDATSHLPANWPFWDFPQTVESRERPKLTNLRKELRFLEPPVQLDEALIDALRQELGRAGESLAAVRKVVSLPKGRYPSSVSPLGTIAYYPVALNMHRIGNLLAYDVLLRAQDKDVDGALKSCRGLLNCGRSTGDEPSVWSRLFRVALNQMTTRNVERTLAQGEASEAALSSIQHDLEEEAKQPSLLLALRGQRAGIEDWMPGHPGW